MMRRKVIGMLLTAALAAATLAGCSTSSSVEKESDADSAVDQTQNGTDSGEGSQGERASEEKEMYKVCYVTPTVADNPSYIKIIELAEQAADEMDDIEFSYVDGGSDTSKQIAGIESCIVDGVDCMIIDPIEGEAVKSYVQEAMDAGVKVISVNANLDVCDVQCLLDQTQLGYQIGEEAAGFINEQLNGKANIGLLHNQENTNLVLRENGIRKALEELAPDAQIVQEATADNQTDGMTGGENMMQADSSIQVIVATNGSAALGAYEGALGMGIAKDDENFGIFASDCADEELKLIDEGTIYRCTIDLLQDIGPGTIGAAKKLLHGENVEDMQLQMTTVNRDNISDYMTN